MNATDRESIAQVYELLSQFWLHELTEVQASQLQSEPLASAWRGLGGIVPSDSMEELAVEYCQLFVGPRDHLPPLQSVWTAAELDGSTAQSVKRFAELVGFEIQGRLPDHVGEQLGLMSHVMRLRYDDTCREIEREFLRRHLFWPRASFFPAVLSKARLEFYQSLVRLTERFIELEFSRVG